MKNQLIALFVISSLLIFSTSSFAEEATFTWEFRDDGKLQLHYSEWGGNWNPWNLSGGACFGYKGRGDFGLMACDDLGYSWTLNNGKMQFKYYQWGGNWNPWSLSGGACYDYRAGQLGMTACDSAGSGWVHHSSGQLEWKESDGGMFVYIGGGVFILDPSVALVDTSFDDLVSELNEALETLKAAVEQIDTELDELSDSIENMNEGSEKEQAMATRLALWNEQLRLTLKVNDLEPLITNLLMSGSTADELQVQQLMEQHSFVMSSATNLIKSIADAQSSIATNIP
ncbi:hypothetical protein [Pleionea sp. CnH1-48]|uniref:hypothetical protein n=1 Tax=Pleionea sp. CnH1-48 TaxID=2954494 RepID=UPI0020973798|nr:hypothetical protein [Pleionea sp. CnH1-48]MCO7227435.1 hypothetical protein [Pleionea sp. CnH1-48]